MGMGCKSCGRHVSCFFLDLWAKSRHERTLGRYNRCSFNHQDNPTEIEPQSWCSEVSKLKAKYESLEQTQRHCLGEDLAPLSIKELQSREKQLEGALAQARQRKLEVNEQRALPSNPSSPCSPLQIYASNSMQIQIQSFMQIGHHHYNLGEGASDPRRMAADINMFQGLTL